MVKKNVIKKKVSKEVFSTQVISIGKGSIWDRIKRFGVDSVPYLKKVWRWIFPKRSYKENLIQYIIRQFLVCDSNGVPSVTTTVLYYSMIIVAIVVWVEVKLALSSVETLNPETHLIVKGFKGFSTEFLWLIFVLVTIITAYAQARSKRIGNGHSNGDGSSEGGSAENGSGASGIINTAIDVISRIRK